MSVRPSVPPWKNLAPPERIFVKFWEGWRGVYIHVEKLQVWSKSDKNNMPKTHLNVTLQAHFPFRLMLNPMVHK